MDISKIYNSNFYLDGTNNQVGRASEVTLPEVAGVTEEHKALGMIGAIEFVMGLAVMNVKIKWNGFYPEHLDGANFFAMRKLQARSNVQTFAAGGLVSSKPLVTSLTVGWKKIPLGVLGAQTSTEFEEELRCNYVKQELDGVELLEIDIVNAIYRVRGKDILADFRKNLGLGA